MFRLFKAFVRLKKITEISLKILQKSHRYITFSRFGFDTIRINCVELPVVFNRLGTKSIGRGYLIIIIR